MATALLGGTKWFINGYGFVINHHINFWQY
jgi:hypothetical protein